MNIDLSEYEKMLDSLNLTRENQIPYMLNWVRKYLHLGSPEEWMQSSCIGGMNPAVLRILS